MKRRLLDRIARERTSEPELVEQMHETLFSGIVIRQIQAHYQETKKMLGSPKSKLLIAHGRTVGDLVKHFTSGSDEAPYHTMAIRAVKQGKLAVDTSVSVVPDRRSRIFTWNTDHVEVYACSSLEAFLKRHPEFADQKIINVNINDNDIDTDRPTNYILYDSNKYPDAKIVDINEEDEK